MPTIKSTDSLLAVNIPIGEALTIVAPVGSSCYVDEPIKFVVSSTVTGATQTFGPYTTAMLLNIQCTAGAVNWSVSKAQSLVATYATDLLTGKVVALNDPSGALISMAPLVTTNSAVIVGDSRVQNNVVDAIVASKTAYLAGRGWWIWLQGLSGGYFTLTNAAGVTGDTIANVNTRWGSANYGSFFNGGSPAITAGAQVGVTLGSPKWIFCELGINNIGAADSLATMQSQAETLIANARALGAYLVWCTEGAIGAAQTGYNTAYLNRILRWNSWLKERAKDEPMMIVPDLFPVTVTPTDAAGNAPSTLFYDTGPTQIHPNPNGAYLRAVAIWNAISSKVQTISRLPASTAYVYNAATAPEIENRQLDPLMQGLSGAVTGTGNTGSLPASFTASNCSNCTAVYSIIADPDGFGNAIQVDVTWTGANGVASFNMPRSESLFAGGETLRQHLKMRVQGVGGVALASTHNVMCVKPQLWTVDSGANNNFRQSFTEGTGDGVWSMGSVNLVCDSLPITLIAGAPTRVQQYVYIAGGVGTSSGCRVIISRAAIIVGAP